jgi:hypothetical protein
MLACGTQVEHSVSPQQYLQEWNMETLKSVFGVAIVGAIAATAAHTLVPERIAPTSEPLVIAQTDEGVPQHRMPRLNADEGVPHNLVTALKADEGVPHDLVTAMAADEGVPHTFVTAMKADEGVPQNLVTA